MAKIGEFIYPWGNGHYSRMMRLNDALSEHMPDAEIHYSSKGEIYERLRGMYSERAHQIMMPTPIDGRAGPDLPRCLLNLCLPVGGNPPLVRQIASYLREERRLYDTERFDLVISDGDMGANILARNRNIPSLFITNQFRPKLWASRFYFYPGLEFISRQIAKATKILVADSPPPYTLCELNLNLSSEAAKKVTYVGHFTAPKHIVRTEMTTLERLLEGADFGYWMRTGNKSTNEYTGYRYDRVFADDTMIGERRIISHARKDNSIDSVLGRDKKRYGIQEAYEKGVDWLQIDVGFLSEQEKDAVLDECSYAVINGSHTVMGEILGGKKKPIIGIPVYDEHTNNLRWAENRGLGVLARSTGQVVSAIRRIRNDAEYFRENLDEFGRNFLGEGASNAARMAAQTLEDKR